MKNSFLFFFILHFFFYACQSKPEKVADEYSDCFCKAFSGSADTTGKKMQAGFIALDNYLRINGFLGAGKIADYQKFANDTNVIYIPASTDSVEFIRLALDGGSAGAPDANAIGRCVDSLIAHSARLDTTDAAYIAAEGFKSMEASGAPDSKAFFDNYFSKVNERDFEKPFSKELFYFLSTALSNRYRIVIN